VPHDPYLADRMRATLYEKRVERPTDDTRTRDEAWLYNVAGASDFNEFMTALASAMWKRRPEGIQSRGGGRRRYIDGRHWKC
jgi:hypothetical protein